MNIRIDDLTDPRVHALLTEHLQNMHAVTPREHAHALDLRGLQAPATPSELRRRGAGRAILNHLLTLARQRGYARVSLETGTHPAFLPAQALYSSAGFRLCGPFGDYRASQDNLFMTLDLNSDAPPR